MRLRAFYIVVLVCIAPGATDREAFAQTPAAASDRTRVEANAGPTMPTWSSLFTDLGRDVRHLPRLESALWIGGGGAASLTIHQWDDQITADAPGRHAGSDFYAAGSVIGNWGVQAGGALGTFVVGTLTSHARLAALGAELVRAQLLAGGLTGGLKITVPRDRPDGGSRSFPSGHASATAVTSTVLQDEFGWRVGVPAHLVTAYVAVSRVHDKQHFASDVVFGVALGAMSGRTITTNHGTSRFRVQPVLTPGGAAVMVIRLRDQ